NKDKISGLSRDTYYEIKVINDDIILSKRRNYEFVNKDLSN
ncbi:type IV pilin, partial [Clostridium perfringens]